MSEWISIKDKFPEFDIWVLVTDGKHIWISSYDDLSVVDEPNSWCSYYASYAGDDRDITHWQELLQPPKDSAL